MKTITLMFFFCLVAIGLQAQPFQKGTTVVNAGIGLGTALGGLGTARPALSIALEHGMWDIGGPGVISLGGYVGNTGYRYTSGGYTQKWNYTVVGVRGAYHYNGFTEVPKLDVYGGAMLAYNIASYSAEGYDGPNTFGSGVGFSVYAGGRWFFSERFGAYAELGYGVSYLNVGVSLKF